MDSFVGSQGFYLFKKKTPKFAVVNFGLSETLTQLVIERVTGPVSAKVVQIVDISTVSDFSPELRRTLIESGCNSRLYGFRLLAKSKSWEIGCESLEARDRWIHTLALLKNAYLDLHRSDGVKRYLQLQCRAEEIDLLSSCSGMTKRGLVANVRRLKDELKRVNREIVGLVVSDVVTQLEIQEEKEKIGRLNEDLMSLVAYYQNEIVELETDLTERAKETIAKQKVWMLYLKRSRATAWKSILPFLCFRDLTRLKTVSTELMRVCNNQIRQKKYWENLTSTGMEPRKHSWVAFCRMFTPDPTQMKEFALSVDEKKQIHGDVQRCEFSKLVEAVLTSLCSKYPEVGYCQGMHLTTEFLLAVLRDDISVLSLLVRLMNSPYHLAEVWKPGLPRVKLVAYQMEALLRLKLPRLARHLEELELPLEIIVAPWTLTLFTQLVCPTQSRIPREVLLRIWDFFLIRGWPAIHAISLSIFHLCEGEYYSASVLGQSLEVTMGCFHRDLEVDFKQVLNTYSDWEPSEELLQDLEKSFQLAGKRLTFQ